MRLDASLGHRANVIHCPTGERLKKCVWVDDQTHRYALFAGVNIALCPIIDVRQAREIVICAGRSPMPLVLIDPIDPDEETARIEAGEVAHG